MKKDCSTCFNMRKGKCATMVVPPKDPPKDYFCWATKEMQLKRENDCLKYAIKNSDRNRAKNLQQTIKLMEVAP